MHPTDPSLINAFWSKNQEVVTKELLQFKSVSVVLGPVSEETALFGLEWGLYFTV